MGLDGNKTKLKAADIRKVDFVPAGAQQHSRISLFKSEDGNTGFIASIVDAISKTMGGFSISPKSADVNPEIEPELVNKHSVIMSEVWDYTHAFHKNLESVLKSDSSDKPNLVLEAIDEFGVAIASALPNWIDDASVAKAGKKISMARMDALKSCMTQLANLIADAESEPAIEHQVDQGVGDAKPGVTPAKEGGQVNNPGGKDENPQNNKPNKAKDNEGSVKKMAEITDVMKAALPQDMQDYIASLEAKVAKAAETKPTEEDVFKGLPEAVVKMMKDQADALKQSNEQIAKMRDEADIKVYVAKAAELTSKLGVKAEEFGPVLKSINAASPELAAKVEAVLKAANEAVAKGNLFAEAGTESNGVQTGVAKADAWAQIETLANAAVAKGDSQTQAQAIDAVLKTADGKRLYAIHQGKIQG